MKVLWPKNLILTNILAIGFFFGLLFSLVQVVFAAPVNLDLNYQGKLTNASGVAVTDGTYNMRFYLYNAVGRTDFTLNIPDEQTSLY